MRQVLLVTAHPDDELLWFGGTILLHADWDWTIVCVTYDEESARGDDFRRVCRQLSARGNLLGFEDPLTDLLDEDELEMRLRRILSQERWDLVFTHNPRGEYGHIHHRQVSRIVRKLWPNAIQSGFGAVNVNAVTRLPEAIFSRKRTLFELYQSAGKNLRLRLYPPSRLDYEPWVIPEGVTFEATERIRPPKTWKQIAGLSDLASREAGKTRRVAVLADTPGWAHDVIIGNVKRNLPPELDLEISFLYDEAFTRHLPVAIDEDAHDLIHLLSWRYWPVIKDWGFPRHKLVTTLIGHRGVDAHDPEFLETMSHFGRVSVVSPRLYKELAPVVSNLFLTPCGVDSQTFFPVSQKVQSGFTVGAVGRHYIVEGEADDIKGWEKILAPLARELRPLQARYLQIDKAARLPHENMPDFYRQLHCYLCASRTEGLPLPLLEAASCGLILLSTDVGIAPEIIVEGQNGRLLPRKVKAFVQAVRELSRQPERWPTMGRYSRKLILDGWDWWSLAPRWAEFYQGDS
jgi:glycosyltransferase involved in cell wall biosynthesis